MKRLSLFQTSVINWSSKRILAGLQEQVAGLHFILQLSILKSVASLMEQGIGDRSKTDSPGAGFDRLFHFFYPDRTGNCHISIFVELIKRERGINHLQGYLELRLISIRRGIANHFSSYAFSIGNRLLPSQPPTIR